MAEQSTAALVGVAALLVDAAALVVDDVFAGAADDATLEVAGVLAAPC